MAKNVCGDVPLASTRDVERWVVLSNADPKAALPCQPCSRANKIGGPVAKKRSSVSAVREASQ
ncbi:predicted protein [Pyrenophora tritici-repentis Pt-1C-BFP]|uniref:Uncharacterized protein n=1 Tax=Pyrenophora tritici-repentis (strain Pt-1C-BFP) TaxID=426418 RepID=B2W7F8_PYRTR|nr:uncharacterized protein PTRG_05746 [Pyrenophora tritici-repentis Pt-1C-BFP]EDU48666.1 predicted protein [Pyrenophora tritici-repentis Pt-1C-BFP]